MFCNNNSYSGVYYLNVSYIGLITLVKRDGFTATPTSRNFVLFPLPLGA